MGSENSKRANIVSEGRGKVSRVISLVVLVSLLATTLSVSFAAVAETEVGVDIDALRSEHKTFYTPSTSIADIASGIKSGSMPDRAGLPMTMIPIEGLEDMLKPGYANNPPKPKSEGDPTPSGVPGPNPNDPPFLVNDILVYNQADSQMNPSIASFDNGDLLVAFDHFDVGDGNRDVYVSKSTDGGLTWAAPNPIAADAGEDEACATIAGDYSPIFGAEMFYSFYNNPTAEFSWSTDGLTWSVVEIGGGAPFWATVSCPYVVVEGDFIFVAAQKYDDQSLFQDTWYIFYTLDNFQTTLAGYYWIMWDDGLSYRPRATITGTDSVMAVVEIFDQTDPAPANWWHDSLMAYGELTGSVSTDNWPYWVWGSGFNNQDYTNPTIASDGAGAVVVTQQTLDPAVIPLSTSQLFCAWTSSVTASGATWGGCNHDAWFLAFDATDTNHQEYPHFHWEPGGAVHAVWVNGTDINYKYSPDGGDTWNGDPATGDPFKVNEVGVGTHLDEWHSPDVDHVGGKPVVAWHDTRGGDSIYFQTFENVVLFTIDTQPSIWDLWVREVGDVWHPPPTTYLWMGGTDHDIETIGNYEIPNDTRYTFNQWDDGSGLNPHTINVGADTDIIAIYDVEYWLEMINPGGTTNPPSGWQAAGSFVTIEAFAPAAPPGGQYVWLGWTGIGLGSYTGTDNPCVSCVEMLEPITQIANWQLQWDVAFDTGPSGLVIEINGQSYVAPYNHWFNDSEMYTVNAPSPQPGGPGLRYTFSSWSDGGPQSHNVFVTAAGESFIATFTPEYELTVTTNVAGLDVRVNGMDYAAPYTFWCPRWSRPWLEAFDPQYLGVLGERYMFESWSTGAAKTHQHNCSATATVTANYVLQRSVNITTNPAGFNVIVDGMTYATPAQFWWNDTSLHTVEALATIPVGANNQYAFVDWSDFGARVHDVTADTSDLTLTANYVFQHKITFQSNEPDPQIELDGVPTALPYVYWCDDGSTHTLNAPSPQTFGDTRYLWASWSDTGGQSHNYMCTAPAIVQVSFDKEYRVYINTTLDGAAHTLDIIAGGTTLTTPATIWWPADTLMTLDTTEFQPGQDPVSGMRYRWVDWDDSTVKTRNVNVDTAGRAFVANFKTQYRLTFSDAHGVPGTVPAGEAVTGGAYFDMGATVEISTDDIVTDTTDHRWRFDGWAGTGSGSYTGSDNPATITMNEAITQTAGWMDQYLLTIVSPHGTPDASGYYEKVTGETKYWYDAGDSAIFWVEAEVSTGTGAKAVFDSWTGGTNGTAMNAALTVTAGWHMEYYVTVDSTWGTPSASAWVVEDGSFSLSVDDIVVDPVNSNTRYQFAEWDADATSVTNGGHDGAARQATLSPVTGPITETAVWTTQHRLTIVSTSGDETGIGDPRTVPAGQEWIDEGSQVAVEVDKTVEIDPNRYTFDGWVVTGGVVADPDAPSTQVTVNGPTELTAEWKSEPLFSIMDLWWVFVIIVIVIVVLIAVLLMRKKKPVEEEVLPPEEEYPAEEPPAPPVE